MTTPTRATPGIFRSFNGTLLHLYLPGFHPGAKQRSTTMVGLCSAQAWDGWRAPAQWFDAPPTLGLPFRWCGKCLGMALVHYGQVDVALEAVAAHFTLVEAL